MLLQRESGEEREQENTRREGEQENREQGIVGRRERTENRENGEKRGRERIREWGEEFRDALPSASHALFAVPLLRSKG